MGFTQECQHKQEVAGFPLRDALVEKDALAREWCMIGATSLTMNGLGDPGPLV